MHAHHHCECSHEHIRFCKHCQRPYCVDCSQEWYAQSWSYSYVYNPYTCGASGGVGGSIGYAGNTACSHSN